MVVGFGISRVEDDDSDAKRRWICMIDEAVCEGKIATSTQLSFARIAYTYACGVLGMDSVFRRMLLASDVGTARPADLQRRQCTG